MAGIILPNRFTRQPQYAAPIDYAGLGRNVRFALIGGPAPTDLCRGVRPGGVLGTVEATPGGLGYVLPVTATEWLSQVTDLDPYVSGSFSVHWHGILRANTIQTLLRVSSGYGWVVATSNNTPSTIRFRLGTNWSGASYITAAIAVTDETLHSLTVVYDSAAGAAEIFLDGVSVGAGAWSTDPNPMGAAINFRMNGHATAPHKMLTVQAFKGKLSNAEIAALTANPWQIFKAPARKLWAVTSSGGGTHNLTGVNSSQGNPSSTALLTQGHALVGATSTQANTTNSGTVTQTQILAGANSGQGNASATGAISQGGALVGAPSSQPNTSVTGTVTQTQVLTASTSTQNGTSSAVAITQVQVLAGADSTQGNLGGTGAISILVPFVGAPSTQANLCGVGQITRTQTLTAVNSTQANLSGTGVISDGIVVESALTTGIAATIRIKKPGVPSGTPEWLKTLLEILIGRRGNRIEVPKFRILTFSATPTKTECEALYSYTNTVRNSLEQLINRMDG